MNSPPTDIPMLLVLSSATPLRLRRKCSPCTSSMPDGFSVIFLMILYSLNMVKSMDGGRWDRGVNKKESKDSIFNKSLWPSVLSDRVSLFPLDSWAWACLINNSEATVAVTSWTKLPLTYLGMWRTLFSPISEVIAVIYDVGSRWVYDTSFMTEVEGNLNS